MKIDSKLKQAFLKFLFRNRILYVTELKILSGPYMGRIIYIPKWKEEEYNEEIKQLLAS